MDIQQLLEVASLRIGHGILLPTPPACDLLVQRARAEGIAVGRLYIVSRSLRPGVCGGYERNTGNLWCHYGAGEAEGEQELLRGLLVLLACVKLQRPLPTTIEEDWGNERDAWIEAAALAQAWQRPDLFPQALLQLRLDETRRLQAWHEAAGELAGNLDPFVAWSAYHALAEIRHRCGWNDEAFEAALYGYSECDDDNAAVLALDRASLRATWSLPYRAQREGPPFGDLTLPYSTTTGHLLRSALETVAHRRGRGAALASIERTYLDSPLQLHFVRVESDLDLPGLLARCNGWLIEEAPDCSAEAMWWVYGALGMGATRLYRLTVHYKKGWRGTAESPAGHELWVLFRPGERIQRVEAALQRYILCWLSVQEVRCEGRPRNPRARRRAGVCREAAQTLLHLGPPGVLRERGHRFPGRGQCLEDGRYARSLHVKRS
jgi:hypothetical protein